MKKKIKNILKKIIYKLLHKSSNFLDRAKRYNLRLLKRYFPDNYEVKQQDKIIFTKYCLLNNSSNTIVFPKFDDIEVSIIIPVYNNYKHTKLCLQSILNNTKDIKYEIIVADDNSTDRTKNIEKYVKNIKVIKNNKTLNFLKNCNNASKYADGKYILFLNNDTQVQSGWLKYLIETIESDEQIGLVGSKFIYPDGTLQEAGGIVYSNSSAANYGRGDDPNKIKYNYVREADYISGACIMLKKQLWNDLGGFDETFCPAYYEDTDLAFQIRYKKHLKVVYVPRSVVIHFESKSSDTNTKSKRMEKNRKLFYKKWEKELLTYHCSSTMTGFTARDRATTKKSILVIDWRILTTQKDTGTRSTCQYLQLFKELGLNIKFFPYDCRMKDTYFQQYLNDGIEIICKVFEEYIRQYGLLFDYIYLNRPNIARCYIDLLRNYTRAKIIYSCQDLHYLRQYRDRLLINKSIADKLLIQEKAQEFDVFRKTDLVCSFSFDEINEIKKEDEYINTEQIPLYILDTNKMKQYNYDANLRSDIMFVAGFLHNPNIDAAIWFAKNVFPNILKKYPNIKLYYVGSNPTQEVINLQTKNIIVTGLVTEEELEKYYSKIKLVVVPLRTGAGVKGKIIESIYHKVPVITTSIGIEGINNKDNIIKVKDTEKDLSEEIINLYENNTELNTISQKSEEFIKTYFSKDAIINIFSKYIKL